MLHVADPVYPPQFLSVRRGWFVGSGSGVVTSSPAAAICPLVKASYRSSWFTTAPLKPIIQLVFVLYAFYQQTQVVSEVHNSCPHTQSNAVPLKLQWVMDFRCILLIN